VFLIPRRLAEALRQRCHRQGIGPGPVNITIMANDVDALPALRTLICAEVARAMADVQRRGLR
jgi:hypothetical protein